MVYSLQCELGKCDNNYVNRRQPQKSIKNHNARLRQAVAPEVRLDVRPVLLSFGFLRSKKKQNHQKPADEEKCVDRECCVAHDLIYESSLGNLPVELLGKGFE